MPTTSPNKPLSNAVIKRKVILKTIQAQRVSNRSYKQTAFHLFTLDVVLRAISDRPKADEVESIVQNLIAKVEDDIDKTRSQMTAIMEDKGYSGEPDYTEPLSVEFNIPSPYATRFVNLIIELDHLIAQVELLWLSGELTSAQREHATYQWQHRLSKLAGRIIGVVRLAKKAAYKHGKKTEIENATKAGEVILDGQDLNDVITEVEILNADLVDDNVDEVESILKTGTGM